MKLSDATPRIESIETESAPIEEPEPRWPAAVAVIAVSGLYTVLPESLSVGPRWLFPVVVAVLLLPTVLSHRAGQHRLNHILGQTVAATVTLFMVWSIALLINTLPTHLEKPVVLLRSAASLWVANVLVFASWYWRLDAGGPHVRDMHASHERGAFLFPQMTLDAANKDESGAQHWTPKFMDYLFLAFNTSTALSPTDTAVLSRWAKALVMIQASISLTIIVILAARAVNIL